eukprot:TRINITY_DN8137_c0_g1_i1.p2 TRINITY_DN8137_c0_g1~~TRINITY_DN8137_c0_g1_i1.p2  ORF type:complete len:124 (-),score=20.58 TRINITY_DN8137_c0_g1_i1:239-610(-)
MGFFFFFSSRRRHTRCREVSWARRCVQETDIAQIAGKIRRPYPWLEYSLKCFFLLHSTTKPFIIISSIIQCVSSRLYMISNSHTSTKYRSSVSTRLWISSKIDSSFSASSSVPTTHVLSLIHI